MSSSLPATSTGPVLPALKQHVIRATGLHYYENRDDALGKHLASRMQHLGISRQEDYLQILADAAAGGEELDRLVELVTVGETHFFRHQELFRAITHRVIPDVLERNAVSRRLRIQCAGCANGAEAYSVSILLQTQLAPLLHGWQISIVGTDINRAALQRARSACYDEWTLRDVPAVSRSQWFERREKQWVVAPRFRNYVQFEYENLCELNDAPSPAAYDIIFCRNVLIYFAVDSAQRVIAKLERRLEPGGWLLVGHAEYSLPPLHVFETVTSEGAILFRKRHKLCSHDADPAPVRLPVADIFDSSRGVSPRKVPLTLPAARTIDQPEMRDESAPEGSALAQELSSLRALADAGQLEPALAACDALLQREPLSAACHLHRGLLLFTIGDLQAAEQSLRRAIYLRGDYVPAHYYLGLVRMGQSDATSAARRFAHVLELLEKQEEGQRFPELDGVSAEELGDLTRMYLSIGESP